MGIKDTDHKPQSIFCDHLHCMAFAQERHQILSIAAQKEELHKPGQPVKSLGKGIDHSTMENRIHIFEQVH